MSKYVWKICPNIYNIAKNKIVHILNMYRRCTMDLLGGYLKIKGILRIQFEN